MDKDRVKNVVKLMTPQEKIALTDVNVEMRSFALPRLKVPSVKLPRELSALFKTSYPPQSALGHTYDFELVKGFARLRNRDAFVTGESYGGVVGLGVIRNPFDENARLAFSDEPNLVSQFAAAYIGACSLPPIGRDLLGVSGFDRYIDETALKELYLKPFLNNADGLGGVAVPTGKLDGVPTAENRNFMKTVTGAFDGLVINEAGGCHDKAEEVSAGACLDVLSPPESRDRLLNAVVNGLLHERKLDLCVERNVYNAAVRYKAAKTVTAPALTSNETESLYLRLAEESSVLLKNDGVLPLNREGRTVCFGIELDGAQNGKIKFSAKTAEKIIRKASDFDVAVVLIESVNSFAPEFLLRFVERLKEKTRPVLLLNAPCYFEMPYLSAAAALVYLPYRGKYTDDALNRQLFGLADFSGRLCASWAKTANDLPSAEFSLCDCYCGESVYIGERYYSIRDGGLLFDCGYGLSYCETETDNFKVTGTGETVMFEFDIRADTDAETVAVVSCADGIVAANRIGVSSSWTHVTLQRIKGSRISGGKTIFTLKVGGKKLTVEKKTGEAQKRAEPYLSKDGFAMSEVEKLMKVPLSTKAPTVDFKAVAAAEKTLFKRFRKRYPKGDVADFAASLMRLSPAAKVRLARAPKNRI